MRRVVGAVLVEMRLAARDLDPRSPATSRRVELKPWTSTIPARWDSLSSTNADPSSGSTRGSSTVAGVNTDGTGDTWSCFGRPGTDSPRALQLTSSGPGSQAQAKASAVASDLAPTEDGEMGATQPRLDCIEERLEIAGVGTLHNAFTTEKH